MMHKKEIKSPAVSLYEEELKKNFQIIQIFLKKFQIIFSRHEYYDKCFEDVKNRFSTHEDQYERHQETIKNTCNNLEKKIMQLKTAMNGGEKTVRFNKETQPSNSRNFEQCLPERGNSKKTFDSNIDSPLQSSFEHEELSQGQFREMREDLWQLKKKNEFLQAFTAQIDQKVDFQSQSNFQRLFKDLQTKSSQQISQIMRSQFQKEQQAISATLFQTVEAKISQLQHSWQQQHSQTENTISEITQELKRTKELRGQFKQVQEDIQLVVDESIEVFADKEETKKMLELLEQKVHRLDLTINRPTNVEKTRQGSEPLAILIRKKSCWKHKSGVAQDLDHSKSEFMSHFGKRKRNLLREHNRA